VVWSAVACAGRGAVYAQPGALTEVPYSLATRFGPNARFVELKGGPHGVLWTHAQHVNSELMKFLA
jgi:hypothetical protein